MIDPQEIEAAIQARERAARAEYKRWFNGLSEQDKAFARDNGLDVYLSDRSRPASVVSGADSPDVYSRLPVGSNGTHNGRAIPDVHLPTEHNSAPDTQGAAETFEKALRWALDGGNIVGIGRRGYALIKVMRPGLARGLKSPTPICRIPASELRKAGVLYSRVLEWLNRAQYFSAIGERIQLLVYKLRPDLLDAATLEQLGSQSNKTRQSQNKIASCLRDTFDGLSARCERQEVTRIRCQNANL